MYIYRPKKLYMKHILILFFVCIWFSCKKEESATIIQAQPSSPKTTIISYSISSEGEYDSLEIEYLTRSNANEKSFISKKLISVNGHNGDFYASHLCNGDTLEYFLSIKVLSSSKSANKHITALIQSAGSDVPKTTYESRGLEKKGDYVIMKK